MNAKRINVKDQKVLVLGLARSGHSAALLLHEMGAFVTVNDKKPLNENSEVNELTKRGIRVICGYHPENLLDEGFSLIVKNPGIPYTNPIVKKAKKRNIPVITEVELAYQIADANFVAVTGTNGKTTTTTIIYKFLQASGLSPLIAGNIGEVASEVVKDSKPGQTIVIELSSFQLLGIRDFRPKISVITNLYEAHLDYHGTREDYINAKKRIFENQTEDDFFITNFDQKDCRDLAEKCRAQIIPFSISEYYENGASIKDHCIFFMGEKIIDIKDIILPGNHNLENILAAISAAKLAGASNDAIYKILSSFSGVKHRLQFVKKMNGRSFYNDSKATNILATETALKSFSQPVILLAGGLDRGNGFEALVPFLKNVKSMIVFGETKEKLKNAGELAGIEKVFTVDNVEEAVPLAYSLSEPGDVILLSPACASWDQYKSFEVRGDIFIKAVHKLE